MGVMELMEGLTYQCTAREPSAPSAPSEFGSRSTRVVGPENTRWSLVQLGSLGSGFDGSVSMQCFMANFSFTCHGPPPLQQLGSALEGCGPQQMP